MDARSDITPVAVLKPAMYRKRIRGRITKLWTAHSATDGKKFSHDFIFVDKEKTAIEGFIEINDPDEDYLLQQIEEGSVYEFFKFIPTNKREGFRTVKHDARIQLTGTTQITKVENDDEAFPLRYFDFKPLDSIGTTITGEKTIVDVIGQVVFIGPIRRVNKNSRRGQLNLTENSGQVSLRDIQIEDERHNKVSITIWEEYLPQIDFQRIEQESKTQEIILAFSSLRLTPFKEKYNLTSYSATRIYQDQFLPEIATFRQRIGKNKKQLILHEATPMEEQLHEQLPPVVSIQELHNMCIPENQGKSFNVVAKISDILEELGWYYESCPIHRTKLREPSYFCYKCEANVKKTSPWFHFKLIVADDTSEAQFSFIGKQAESLVGSSAQDLLYGPNNKGKKKHLPPIFQQLLNKEHMFTVQWERNKFTNSSIYYHVTNIQDVPPTTPKELSTTSAAPYGKNSFESQQKPPITSDTNKTRRQLFAQGQSKKQRTSGEGSSEAEEKLE